MENFIIENGVLLQYKGKQKSPVIPDGVTEIGILAFNWHRSLKSIVIPDSVTSIGGDAFSGCVNLQSITIGNGVTIIHSGVFDGCKRLQNITIPESVTSIGHFAFRGCVNLQSITIPDHITYIGDYIFRGCNPIKKCVIAPASQNEEQCKMIVDAFGTKMLAYSFLTGNIKTNPIIEKLLKSKVTAKAFRTKYIPELIENRETEAFIQLLSLIKKMEPEEIDGYIEQSANNTEFCAALLNYKNRLYTPDVLDQIEEIQMEKDFGLREKTLADYRKDFKIVKEGDHYVITGYKSENTTVIIPGNIKGTPVKFRKEVFQYNTDIQSVLIEDGIRSIDNDAFNDCENLQNITIPDSVTSIGRGAFYCCTNLKDITIPDSVTEIDSSAFGGCPGMTMHANNGSYAEKYAKAHNIKFKAL